MKGLPFSRRHIVIASGILILFGTLFFVCHRIFALRDISCAFDECISPNAQHEVLDVLMDLKQESGITPSGIIKELNQEFKWIDSIAVRRQPNNKADVFITAQQPFCLLNTNHVLTRNGAIIAKGHYENTALTHLPTVRISDKKLNDTDNANVLQRYLAHMPKRVFQEYEIHCQDDLAFSLRDKSCKQFSILCNSKESIDAAMLDQCAHIKKQLEKRGSFKTKKNWVADIRFSNQIVISGHSGGGGHGTHTC